MLAEFSIVPLGMGESVGAQVSAVLDIVDKSGLDYRLNPMGTVVEGEWDEVMGLIKKCHDSVMAASNRTLTTIRIDDRKGRSDLIVSKTGSIEKRLGRGLRR